MSRTYIRYKCEYCGKTISTAGVARWNHMKKHEREGLVLGIPRRIKGLYGYTDWQPTLEGRKFLKEELRRNK